MTKLIGIVTPTGVYNYGTKLQAYAMQEIFSSRGYDTEVILYIKNSALTSRLKDICGKFLMQLFPKLMTDRKYKKYIKQQYNNLPNSFLIPSIKKRIYAIDSINNNYNYRRFKDEKALNQESKRYVAAVCGSDQIWNPFNNGLEFTLLLLLNSQVRCISYAPSIGVSSIPESMKSLFKKAMKNMHAISVREASAVEVLQGLSDKPVQVVLDPTLLTGKIFWDRVLKEKTRLTERSYCLCYLLGTTAEHRKMCSEFAKKQGLELYNFSHFKKFNEFDEQLEGEHLYDVTPAEFVGLISKAKFIVTDSFHCSCFSMMYHIPFATLLRYQSADKESTNSRIFSLLGQFGLENRICRSFDDVDKIISSDIDYQSVDRILESKRKESNEFIDNALKGL